MKISLAFKLRQLPLSALRFAHPPATPPDTRLRQWALASNSTDLFVTALGQSVAAYLPTCFLEGYERNVGIAQRFGFSLQPEVIMTANSFSSDDLWKLWAGNQVEQGARLVVSQHGGHYGIGAWSSSLKHEVAISDRYLSWGWSDSRELKIYPAPATKLIGLRRGRSSADGRCLQVLNSIPRQSSHLITGPVGPQFADYLADQQRFVSALSAEVRESLTIRLSPYDYGWDVSERWSSTHPEITVEPGRQAMSGLLKDVRLFVGTYNATSFLESISLGIPTVTFWDPEFWEVSDDARPFLLRLRQAKVLFEDPRACAEHVNEIWGNVPKWWGSKNVQAAVSTFSHRYAYVGSEPIAELAEALKFRP